MKRIAVVPALLLLAGGAQGGESLSCRLKAGGLTAAAQPVLKDFTWSTAHGEKAAHDPIQTSIGSIAPGSGPGYNTVITLNGAPIKAPVATAGLIRFGKVYDFKGSVAIAYLVEREEDSSASPSQVVLLLGTDGVVVDTDILPGTATETTGHCTLIE